MTTFGSVWFGKSAARLCACGFLLLALLVLPQSAGAHGAGKSFQQFFGEYLLDVGIEGYELQPDQTTRFEITLYRNPHSPDQERVQYKKMTMRIKRNDKQLMEKTVDFDPESVTQVEYEFSKESVYHLEFTFIEGEEDEEEENVFLESSFDVQVGGEENGAIGDNVDNVDFQDVPASSPYAEAVHWARVHGVLTGYPDGTFQPDEIINRAEFLKIVLLAKGIDLADATEPAGFSDVNEEEWYAPYIRFAKQQGIIQGYPDGTFQPERYVNVSEGLKMAYVTLEVPVDDFGGEWYQKYATHAADNHIFVRKNLNVRVKMSRKDVVWLVWKLATEFR